MSVDCSARYSAASALIRLDWSSALVPLLSVMSALPRCTRPDADRQSKVSASPTYRVTATSRHTPSRRRVRAARPKLQGV